MSLLIFPYLYSIQFSSVFSFRAALIFQIQQGAGIILQRVWFILTSQLHNLAADLLAANR